MKEKSTGYIAAYYASMETSKFYIFRTYEEAKKKLYEMFGEDMSTYLSDMADDLREDVDNAKYSNDWLSNFYCEEVEGKWLLISDNEFHCYYEVKECEINM